MFLNQNQKVFEPKEEVSEPEQTLHEPKNVVSEPNQKAVEPNKVISEPEQNVFAPKENISDMVEARHLQLRWFHESVGHRAGLANGCDGDGTASLQHVHLDVFICAQALGVGRHLWCWMKRQRCLNQDNAFPERASF